MPAIASHQKLMLVVFAVYSHFTWFYLCDEDFANLIKNECIQLNHCALEYVQNSITFYLQELAASSVKCKSNEENGMSYVVSNIVAPNSYLFTLFKIQTIFVMNKLHCVKNTHNSDRSFRIF